MDKNVFSYLRAPRSSVPLEQLSAAQMGHIAHTLLDSIHRVLLLDKANSVPEDKTNLSVAEIDKLPPDFVREFVSDWRAAKTFFINTARDASKPTTHPTETVTPVGATHVADVIHGMQRAKAAEIAKHVKWSGPIAEDVAEYNTLIKEYGALVKKHGTYLDIPKPELEEYTGRFGAHFRKLQQELVDLDHVTLEVDGQEYPISNKDSLTDKLENCKPATLLFFLGDVSKGAADRNRRPDMGWNIMKQLGGERSLISDVMTNLQEHIEREVGTKLDLFKMQKAAERIKPVLQEEARKMKLLYQVIGITGDMYPQSQGDIQRLLNDVGETPAIDKLESPKEAALLLYSSARSMENHGCKDNVLLSEMESLAQELSTHDHFDKVVDKDSLLQLPARVAAQNRQLSVKDNISGVLNLITDSLSGPQPGGQSAGLGASPDHSR